MQKAAEWPCGVCGRGVSNNSIQCTSCLQCFDAVGWVVRTASGLQKN